MLLKIIFVLLACYSTVSFSLVTIKDKRKIVSMSENADRENLSRSIFTFFEKEKLVKTGGTYRFASSRTHKEYLNLCEGEKFADLPAPAGFCTGFLIDSQTGLTAGHCTDQPENFCEKHYIVFDYVHGRTSFDESQVLTCEEVLAVVNYLERQDIPDQAIIKFKHPLNRPFFKLSTVAPSAGTPVYTIGHPKGLPQMIADGAQVLPVPVGGLYFETDVDTFKGNSGGPVIHAFTHEVLGIMSHYVPRGLNWRDYDYVQTTNGCFKTYIQNPLYVTAGASRIEKVYFP